MDYIAELIERYPSLSVWEKDIRAAAEAIIESYKKGGKLIAAGNGGSAADSDHITGELLKSFVKNPSEKAPVKKCSKIIICPVLDTGSHSVIPSIMPITVIKTTSIKCISPPL